MGSLQFREEMGSGRIHLGMTSIQMASRHGTRLRRKRLEDSALGYSKIESLEEQRIQRRRAEMDVSTCYQNTYTLRQFRRSL